MSIHDCNIFTYTIVTCTFVIEIVRVLLDSNNALVCRGVFNVVNTSGSWFLMKGAPLESTLFFLLSVGYHLDLFIIITLF